MKSLTRRFLSLTLVLALVLSLSTLLSGCYMVKSGKMNQVEGTYKLTGYTGKTNYLEERGIELYIVIRSDGTGFYAYKANGIEPHISEIRCSFERDPEESDKYSYVSINFGNGSDPIKLAIVAQIFKLETNLNSQKPVWKPIVWGETPSIDYNIDVDFTRVSTATDLSYIHENFGNYNLVPYGVMRYSGTYEAFTVSDMSGSAGMTEYPEYPFVYCYLDIDLVTNKGKIWYMLKSDETARVVDFDVSVDTDGMGGYKFKFDTTEIKTEAGSSSATYISLPFTTTLGEFAIRLAHQGNLTEETITESAQIQYENYLASKPQE